jgi:hypothetical protein
VGGISVTSVEANQPIFVRECGALKMRAVEQRFGLA